MNEDFNQKELSDLFSALLAGTITPEEHAKLESLLAGNAEARQWWFLHCDVETGLAEWAAGRSSVVPMPPVAATPIRNWWALAAAAAVLALGFFWWRPSPVGTQATTAVEAPASGVAVVASLDNAEWEGDALQTGAVLSSTTLRLKSGSALVDFFTGARVVLEGPAELRLVSAGEAFLVSGKINAHVPPQAKGFTVGSAMLKVIDLGTEFGLECRSGRDPEVHVFQGKVDVIPVGQPPQSLHAGEAVRASASGLSRIPAVETTFLKPAALAQRSADRAVENFAAWREGGRALSDEPAAALHFTFDDADAAAHRVANQCFPGSMATQGSIVGSGWTEGRWPGKRALDFRSEGDRVRLIVAKPMTTVTLLAWLRVSALPRPQNVILSSDVAQPGALRWHLTQPGELRLEIARDLGRPKPDWEAVNSPPFLTPERLGQWTLLATTFDGSTIRHYGNGRLIGSGASFTPPALRIDTAELANWNGDTKRNLAAAMDEFAILSRALSAEEILSLYQAGKP